MTIVIVMTEDNEIVGVFHERKAPGFGYYRDEIHNWEVESPEDEE